MQCGGRANLQLKLTEIGPRTTKLSRRSGRPPRHRAERGRCAFTQRIAQARPLTRPFIGRLNRSSRWLEERRNDGERRGWMLLDYRNCPKSANCLGVLNRNSPADNDRWE